MARVFMKGCEAMAEAAVRAGCRFFAGYPITPQNEIPEYMSRRLPEVGGHFVQGESEVASVNMVYGAASAGTRAMTSSSSPGIALKSEGISYCAAARIPIVYINVARGGPGVGSIQPAQMDYMQATKASGNGGFEMRVFAPSTVQEAVDFTYRAFDLADQDRNPVLILADGVIGTMIEPVVLPEMRSDEEVAASRSDPDYSKKTGIGNYVGFPYYGDGALTADGFPYRTNTRANAISAYNDAQKEILAALGAEALSDLFPSPSEFDLPPYSALWAYQKPTELTDMEGILNDIAQVALVKLVTVPEDQYEDAWNEMIAEFEANGLKECEDAYTAFIAEKVELMK